MEELTNIAETEYVSPRRMAGLARLAIHCEFENSMSKADEGKMTRENALAHIIAIRPRILKGLGVIEGFDGDAV